MTATPNTGRQRQSLVVHFTAEVIPDPSGAEGLFAVDLLANDIHTRVRLDGLTEQVAIEQAEILAHDGPDVLLHYGIWDEVYAKAYGQRAFEVTGLRLGDWVALREALAGFPKGHPCRVERIDLDPEGGDVDGLCPILVRPRGPSEGMSDTQFPLGLDEVEPFRP